MTKQRTTNRLWGRTTKALGKFFAAVVSSPQNQQRKPWNDYPLFPPY
jgi:hypothetical protein